MVEELRMGNWYFINGEPYKAGRNHIKHFLSGIFPPENFERIPVNEATLGVLIQMGYRSDGYWHHEEKVRVKKEGDTWQIDLLTGFETWTELKQAKFIDEIQDIIRAL